VPGAPPHHRQHGFANVPPIERPGFWTVQVFRARRVWAALAGTFTLAVTVLGVVVRAGLDLLGVKTQCR